MSRNNLPSVSLTLLAPVLTLNRRGVRLEDLPGREAQLVASASPPSARWVAAEGWPKNN